LGQQETKKGGGDPREKKVKSQWRGREGIGGQTEKSKNFFVNSYRIHRETIIGGRNETRLNNQKGGKRKIIK